MSTRLYNLPQLYDNAFSWDLSQEIDFFKRAFETHVPFPVRHILEPACGSGRFLRTLPSYGFRVTGYDVNPAMVQYATESVAAAGWERSVRIVLADMVSAEIPGEFDAAFNAINSIGFLHSDDDVVSHLKVTGSSLREGGIYLVHLNFGHEGELPDGVHWTMDRDGINVKISWRILSEDKESKLSHQIGSFEIEQDSKKEQFDFLHTLRLWLFSDLQELIQRSGQFEVVAIYGEDFEELNDWERLSGELGNVYLHTSEDLSSLRRRTRGSWPSDSEEKTRRFFGHWYDLHGKRQCGYYLGHEVLARMEALDLEREAPCAAHGAWTADDRFAVKLCYTESAPIYTLTLRFEQQRVVFDRFINIKPLERLSQDPLRELLGAGDVY